MGIQIKSIFTQNLYPTITPQETGTQPTTTTGVYASVCRILLPGLNGTVTMTRIRGLLLRRFVRLD